MLTEKIEKDAGSLNIYSIRMSPSTNYVTATEILRQYSLLLPRQQVSIIRVLHV